MSKTTGEKRSRFVSLRVRILIGFTVLFSVVFAVAFYWFYNFATDQAMQRIQEDMVDTLNGAIAGVDGDAFIGLAREAEPNEAGQTDDPRYAEHQAWLETVHNIEPRALPYTYVPGDEENELMFVGDMLQVVRPDDAAAFLESWISRSGAMVNSLQGLTLKMEPYSDPWGEWVSAYAPISTAEGEKVGAMGIDFEASYVREVQEAIRNTVAVAFLITYATLFVLVLLISRGLTQPVIALTAVAEQVAEGDYGQDISALHAGRLRDEVATLAQVFEMMVDKVRAREERLKQEVAQLRIEIDQAKRERHVAEITESEYFQDLQKKAKKIRKKSE